MNTTTMTENDHCRYEIRTVNDDTDSSLGDVCAMTDSLNCASIARRYLQPQPEYGYAVLDVRTGAIDYGNGFGMGRW